MIDVTVRVEGATVAARRLQNLAAEIPVIGRLQIYYRMIHIRSRMRKAPRRVPTYARTGTLHGSWELERQSQGYRLSADPVDPWGTHYGAFVHGDASGAGQAFQHQGNWPHFKTVVDEEVKKLPPEIERYIRIEAIKQGLA